MPTRTSEDIVHDLLLRLVEARKNAGISQERLAELSGVDLGVISRAENLVRIPGMASILDLAFALDVDPVSLLAEASKDFKGDKSRG
jgi:transcriptional regulator with XRE-family HTH domain